MTVTTVLSYTVHISSNRAFDDTFYSSVRVVQPLTERLVEPRVMNSVRRSAESIFAICFGGVHARVSWPFRWRQQNHRTIWNSKRGQLIVLRPATPPRNQQAPTSGGTTTVRNVGTGETN